MPGPCDMDDFALGNARDGCFILALDFFICIGFENQHLAGYVWEIIDNGTHRMAYLSNIGADLCFSSDPFDFFAFCPIRMILFFGNLDVSKFTYRICIEKMSS